MFAAIAYSTPQEIVETVKNVWGSWLSPVPCQHLVPYDAPAVMGPEIPLAAGAPSGSPLLRCLAGAERREWGNDHDC